MTGSLAPLCWAILTLFGLAAYAGLLAFRGGECLTAMLLGFAGFGVGALILGGQRLAAQIGAAIARMRSEERLRESDQRYRALFNRMLDGMAVHEMLFDSAGVPYDFRYLQVNPAFEAAVGLTAGAVEGRTARELFPEMEEYWFSTYCRVVATGEPVVFEDYFATLDKYFSVVAYSNAPGQFATVFSDVTQRRRDQDRLRAERDLAIALARTGDLTAALDLCADAIAGLAGEQIVGLWLMDERGGARLACHRGGNTVLIEKLQEFSSGDPILQWLRGAGPVYCPAGELPERLAEICLGEGLRSAAILPVSNQGQMLAVLAVASVHQMPLWVRQGLEALAVHIEQAIVRLRGEADLQAYARAMEAGNRALEQLNALAESATRTKSEFLANMSHEIRTPMTAILGYADLLAESAAHPEQREAIQTIRRNGQHLLAIINDILDLSKIEAGRLEVERRPFDPTALLREVVELMQVRAEEKGLDLRLQIGEPLPAAIVSDPLRLRQIIVNLVGNAIKFTEKGEVVMAAEWRATEERGELRCTVRDTGIGIEEEQLEHLFQPFEQADMTTNRRFGGTGLGLAISQRLAGLLLGGIEVQSERGRGSTFRLIVPAEAAAGPVDPPLENQAMPDRNVNGALCGARILLAEDGPDNQRLIGLLLRKAGAEVTVVENGQEALEGALAARQAGSPFDVVLMDMQMPVMDGYEAARSLRQSGYDLPVIALTAHAMTSDRDRCLQAGCIDYLAKPIDRQRLIGMAAKYLEQPSAVSDCGSHI